MSGIQQTLTLPPDIVQSIHSLANADDFETLTSEECLQQLQNARIIAQQLVALDSRDQEIAAYEEANARLQIQIRDQQRTINALSTAATADPTNNATIREEKIPDPDEFDGNRAALRTFIDKLRLKVGDLGRYPNEQSKLRYAFSRLKGAAFDQVRIYLLDERINLENIAALIQHLEAAFDDPDRTATAERRKIVTCTQRTGLGFGGFNMQGSRQAGAGTRNKIRQRGQARWT
jgi:hypothetical protein